MGSPYHLTLLRWIYSYLGTTASHIEVYQTKLFQYVNEVYDTGARNFLFIEVLPMERAPGCKSSPSTLCLYIYMLCVL